jgi:hypothetical protein
MALTATRRTVLAGGTMLLAGRAAAQQVTTLRLYTMVYDIEAEMSLPRWRGRVRKVGHATLAICS